MAVSKRTRFEVFRRDNHTCRYCRSNANELTVDHVVPVSLGGSDKPENLVAACRDCNAGKSSSSPDTAMVAQVTDDAMRWAAALREAATKMLSDHYYDADYADEFDGEWSSWGWGEPPNRKPVPRDGNWRDSLRRWRSLGVPIEIVRTSATAALGNRRVPADEKWRYMCGIVWARVTELQEAASQSVSGNSPLLDGPCGHCEPCAKADDEEPCSMLDPAEDWECPLCKQPGCLYYLGWTRAEEIFWKQGYDWGISEGRRFEGLRPTFGKLVDGALVNVCDAEGLRWHHEHKAVS